MINEETLSILDDVEALSDMIVNSEIYDEYIKAKELLNQNDEAHLLYSAFLKTKDQYDDVMRFGR
ncbi:YlbF family regulator, partial [Bacillus sp. JR_15]